MQPQRRLFIVLAGTSALLLASVLFTVFHNGCTHGTVHQLEHSAVCKWVKDGKLCNNNSPVKPFAAALSTVPLAVFLLMFPATVHRTRCLSIVPRYLSTHHTRAPPA